MMSDNNDDLNAGSFQLDSANQCSSSDLNNSLLKNKKKKRRKAKRHMKIEKMDVEPQQANEVAEEPRAYIPGRSRPLMQDEELVMDKSSYRMFYHLQVESSCLSFDLLLDNLGTNREVEVNGPATSACLVTGTQASRGTKNTLVVMKLENLKPFSSKKKSENTESDCESDSDESSSDEDLDSQPDLEAATIQHEGTVNRIRAHQHGGRYLAASWSETAKVFIWDLTRPLTAVNDSAVMSEYVRYHESPAPIFTFKGHRSEGFALDWSPHTNATGYLASGDCNGSIHVFSPRSTSWAVGRSPYTGHTGSVEDIQWSFTEPTVFISVSADRSIRVWDTRSPPSSGSMLTVPEAHPADINVLSWNRLQSVSLLTGGDDGSLRIWDLRAMNRQFAANRQSTALPAYTHIYEFHTQPITSVEWHPTDAGVFVATAEDDQVTIWDNTLEQAEQSESTSVVMDDEAANLPVQLLFIHCGQNEIKEAHWHPQIPGLLLVTSLDGFNVFRTCNV